MKIRRAADRGHVEHGWLDTYHTFSFGDYHDPEHMGFRDLRVINEDVVAPKTGFPTHPHRDMEILTYVLSGSVAHADSMGNAYEVRAGDVQRMTAGTGVRHSEANPSDDEPLHLLQIWILPERAGLEPGYEQKSFAAELGRGGFRRIASRDGRDGSLTIHQDVALFAAVLRDGESAAYELAPDRHAWLQVVRGAVEVDGAVLEAGDGAAISDRPALDVCGKGEAEVLLFDLR